MKKIILASILAAATMPAIAQQQQDMYLIKDDHVVAKYNVDDVDYVSFSLPEGVTDSPLWVETGNVAKNSITYSVKTTSPMTAYAHGIVTWNTLNNYALSYYDDEFNNLPEGTQVILMKAALQQVGYVGFGNYEYTMTDWQDDGTGNEYYTSRFSVRGGLKYFVMAQEIDINTQEPLDTFFYTTVETPQPGKSPYTLDVKVARAADEQVELDFTGSDDNLLYCLVGIMEKNTAAVLTDLYGADYIFNTWAYPWDMANLKDSPVWNVFDSGEYRVMVRGVDANGDVVDAQCDFTYVSTSAGQGPEIKFYSHDCTADGSLSVNFEITPSNVTEAYVCLETENNVDDLKNDGWELWEIASRSTATDITESINTTGEYTFKKDLTDEAWYALLVYAKDKDGNKTVAKAIFGYFDGEFFAWDVTNPASAPAMKARPFKSRTPRSLSRIQK